MSGVPEDHIGCRHLLVDDTWISLAEGLLIDFTQPAWSCVLDGFGNHPVGKGHGREKRSTWDTLHPGRKWALRPPANSQSRAARGGQLHSQNSVGNGTARAGSVRCQSAQGRPALLQRRNKYGAKETF
ncbi:MAG: Eco29kI family restriction endonuclease [candidate division WOR-3 bacterium]|nr:Eco29kI family restriction endonuclease [candidate division WOR-3 bacterium]